MTPVVRVGLMLGAFGLALWAGLLTLGQEARAVARTVAADDGTRRGRRRGLPAYRAMQVARLVLIVLAATAAGTALEWWFSPPLGGALNVVVGTGLVFMLAEMLPRALGVLAPAAADHAAPTARRSLLPFAPFLGLVAVVEHVLELVLPPPQPSERPARRGERDLLAGVVSLRETTVEEAMTPRLDVQAVEAGSDWSAVVEHLRHSEHARHLVVEGDLDDVVGVLYAKDLTAAVAGVRPVPDDWRELMRPAQYVPESKTLDAQLRDFQRGPSHLAIVVDEFGGTSGLITLEDVLEEVVGEIHGEYDGDVEPPLVSEGADKHWVDGTVSLDTLAEALEAPIDREDVTTVGGLIYSELGHVPRPGEELRIGEFRVVVEQVVRRRIRRVYFERIATAEPATDAEESG